MARGGGTVLLIICLFVVCSWIPSCYCSKKQSGLARKEDIPYIKCGVCKLLANQLYQQVHNKQAQISPKKVIFLHDLIWVVTNFLNLWNQESG